MKYILASLLAFSILAASGLNALAVERRASHLSERTGMRQVFRLIGGVNLKQSDLKTQQTLQDVTEWRAQSFPQTVSRIPATTPAKPPMPLRKAF